MEADDTLTATLGNLALFGATLSVYAAIRNRTQRPASRKGVCRVCSGTGVQDCTLCYGRGSIARPGYLNVANPLHRQFCLRCEGAKKIVCCSCGGVEPVGVKRASRLPTAFRDNTYGNVDRSGIDNVDAEDF
ncbi:hypothetical protein COCOBI_11-1770 [Coccomyxa sp. Obi]|nr:hypothetical protein COCOBI_11-1770 [Coccomyxa sp. Obi]